MATGGEVIKEYVVSIRYNVDDSALKDVNSKFDSSISHIGISLKGLDGLLAGFLTSAGHGKGFVTWASSLGATFGALAVTIDKTTEKFSNLYYLQQKINNSFQGPISSLLKAQVAGELSGLGKTGLTDQLLSVATDLRNQPKDILLKIGTGGATDPLQALINIAQKYNSLTPTQEYSFRSQLSKIGIDPNVIMQLGQNLPAVLNGLGQFSQTLSQLQFSPDQLAQNSVDFQRNITILENIIELFVDDTVSEFLPTINKDMISLLNWINANSASINSDLGKLPTIFEGIGKLIHTIVSVLYPIAKDATIGAFVSGQGLGLLIQGFEAGSSGQNMSNNNGIGWLLGRLFYNPLGNINNSQDINQIKTDGQAIGGFFSKGFDWLSEKTHSPYVQIYEAQGIWTKIGNWLLGGLSYVPFVQIKPSTSQTSTENLISTLGNQIQQQQNLPLTSGTPITSSQQNKNMDQAVAFFQSKGLSFAQSVGIASRLFAESGLNPNAVNPTSGAYGIAQWLGARKSAATATNGDLNAQLGLVWSEFNSTERKAYEAILSAKTAAQAATAMEQFERAGNPAFTAKAAALATYFQNKILSSLTPSQMPNLNTPPGIAPLSASGNQTSFSPSTTIHFHGSQGAEISAKVESAVYRAHSKLLRNFYTQVS